MDGRCSEGHRRTPGPAGLVDDEVEVPEARPVFVGQAGAVDLDTTISHLIEPLLRPAALC
jgi:hypothetical protein